MSEANTKETPKGSGSLEFDSLLAAYHAVIWASAEDGDCDYDMAGIAEAKKLQTMFREKEFSDAYQGCREDLADWKRRALEAEAKVREQDQTIERLGDALNNEHGPTYMGEPNVQDESGVRPAASADGAYRFNPLTGHHE